MGMRTARDPNSARPEYGIHNDDNTGLKSSAADTLSLMTGGTAALTVDSSQVVNVGADKLKVNSVIVPAEFVVNYVGQTASATDTPIFIAHRACQVTACYQVHSVAAGGASKLQLVKDTGTDAPGAGTNLLTNNTNAGFDLNATANTLQTGTLTATEASLQLAAGNRLSLDWADAIQSSATVVVTVVLKYI